MERVEAMGGSFDVNLTMSTTHLLAASSNTEKYRVATSMKARSRVTTTVVVQYVAIHPCEKTLMPAYALLIVHLCVSEFNRCVVTELFTHNSSAFRDEGWKMKPFMADGINLVLCSIPGIRQE